MNIIKNKYMQLNFDRIGFFFGLYTLEFYWPTVYFNKSNSQNYQTAYGFLAKTMVMFRPEYDWKWDWSFCALVLGFGFGIAKNHCQNPNRVDKIS
jgi:hypothetical protein